MIGQLAWRNLWRQPRRTWLSLLAIAFGSVVTVFLLALQQGVYRTMKENVLHVFDGFAQVQAPNYADDPSLHKTLDQWPSLADRLQQLPGIDAVAPRAMTYAVLSHDNRSFGAAIVGIDPAREPAVSVLNHTVKQGRYLKAGDSDAVVLGSALARDLEVKPGDQVTLLGSDRDGSMAVDLLKVAGLYHTGDSQLDRQMAQMPLARFQSDFAMGHRINTLVLGGRSLAAVNRALPQAKRLLQGQQAVVRSWGQLEPGLKAAIELDASTSLLWYISLVVVVVFILLNTLLMSVFERTREFGVLLAIGMQPPRLGRMVWTELGLLALLGMLLGMALGAALTFWFSVHGLGVSGADALFAQWGLPGRMYPQLSLFSLCTGPAAIALGILLTGLIPYRRIQRMQPVTAMRAP